MPNIRNTKLFDLFILVLLLAIAVVASLSLQLSLLAGILIFFIPPALWLSYQNKNKIKTTALFASVATILFVFIDYVCVLNNAWLSPNVVFPRLFGFVVVEDLIWGFLAVYCIVLFYENFFGENKVEKISPRFKYLAGVFVLVLITMAVLVKFDPEILRVKYAYAWVAALTFFFPPLLLLYFLPKKTVFNILKVEIFFFVFGIANELTAISLG
ncbi:MAG TPA: hypothetical protein ENI70_00985, partial [Candidatus Peregrinibacteria bacterium]|nr:hypothetical protein [Candidatus Peregrinibacteria bacterium]